MRLLSENDHFFSLLNVSAAKRTEVQAQTRNQIQTEAKSVQRPRRFISNTARSHSTIAATVVITATTLV